MGQWYLRMVGVMCAFVGLVATAAGSTPLHLKFNGDHKFKIVQFTDNHYKVGKKASSEAVKCIETIVDVEKPDLVMFTGDLVYSEGVTEALDAVLAPIVSRGIPFGFVLGNHDTQFELDKYAFYDYLQSKPGGVMPKRKNDADTGSGVVDYVVEIMSSDDAGRPAATLYCIDSHTVSSIPHTGKYDWIKFDQILWYRTHSDAYTNQNDGVPVPSLMFFHIPLPEVKYAYDSTVNYFTGVKKEKVCCPEINSGMFESIREKGDVIGAFFGHDHDNDFAINYYDVLLGYGRYSGGNTVYNHLGDPGARVIVMHEGSRELDTWIRLANQDLEIKDKVAYPADFINKNRKR